MPQTELIIIVIVVTIFSRSDVIASTYNVKSKNSFQRNKESVSGDCHKILWRTTDNLIYISNYINAKKLRKRQSSL